jgi:hypothetical protein
MGFVYKQRVEGDTVFGVKLHDTGNVEFLVTDMEGNTLYQSSSRTVVLESLLDSRVREYAGMR